jgi:hypothetical protein
LTVTIPHTAQTAIGSPTGQVFNGSNDFAVAPGKPGSFIFVSLDGTISAWNPGVNPTNAIQKVPGSTKSILTGATIAEVEGQRFFYVADLEAGKITVYDTNFNPVEVGETEFDDKHGEHAFEDGKSRRDSLRSLCKTLVATCTLPTRNRTKPKPM